MSESKVAMSESKVAMSESKAILEESKAVSSGSKAISSELEVGPDPVREFSAQFVDIEIDGILVRFDLETINALLKHPEMEFIRMGENIPGLNIHMAKNYPILVENQSARVSESFSRFHPELAARGFNNYASVRKDGSPTLWIHPADRTLKDCQSQPENKKTAEESSETKIAIRPIDPVCEALGAYFRSNNAYVLEIGPRVTLEEERSAGAKAGTVHSKEAIDYLDRMGKYNRDRPRFYVRAAGLPLGRPLDEYYPKLAGKYDSILEFVVQGKFSRVRFASSFIFPKFSFER